RADLGRDAAFVERFERELHTTAALQGEHVVSIVDSGKLEDGRPYFVMERLHGEDLRTLLERTGPLPAARAVNIAIGVCRALQTVHAAGIVHRDLKPENVFIARADDGRDRVKLLDFGVAQRAEQGATSPGTLVGTMRYMAPEQVCTDRAVGAYTDIFALGVILYECLTGRSPFEADTQERMLFAIMNHEPPALDGLRPALPRALTRAVHRALAKRPEHRHGSALELAEQLSSSARASAGCGESGSGSSCACLGAPAPTLLPHPLSTPASPAPRVRRSLLAAVWARVVRAVSASGVLDRPARRARERTTSAMSTRNEPPKDLDLPATLAQPGELVMLIASGGSA
ncbi:MAG TPA: serine/threonine-protein kinase, partial [Polyangiaceae bacterium]|nr:serine/threonine-protein kinase [Polyangiaceae bacterium]